MSLFEQEFEQGEIKAASKRLGSLFGGEDNFEEVDASFQYEASPSAKSTPSRKKTVEQQQQSGNASPGGVKEPFTRVAASNRILYATTVTQLYKTAPDNQAYGAAGVALMEEKPRSTSLVVYDRSKTPFFRCEVHKDFVIIPQKDNYVCVYDGNGQTWSLLCGSEEESEKFVYSVAHAKLMSSTLATGGAEGGETIQVLQDLTFSGDDKIAEKGDTVQVVFSGWLSKSHQARHMGKEDILVRESTVKLEVGKAPSSAPSIISTAVLGMRRGSKKLALTCSREPQFEDVWVTQAYEVTLSKMKKGKGNSRSRKGTGSASFSLDNLERKKSDQSSSTHHHHHHLESVEEPNVASPEQSSPPKSEKQALIERMARLSAAQNPLTATFNVAIGQPSVSPPRKASSVTSQASGRTSRASEGEGGEPEVKAESSQSSRRSTDHTENVPKQRENEDASPPPASTQAEAVSNEDINDSMATVRPNTTQKRSLQQEPVASPTPSSSSQQMVLPPGWHYIAPPESAPPPPSTSNLVEIQGLSSQMERLLSLQESMLEKMNDISISSSSEKDPDVVIETKEDSVDKDLILTQFQESLSRIVELSKAEMEKTGPDAWNEHVASIMESAVQQELEALENHLKSE